MTDAREEDYGYCGLCSPPSRIRSEDMFEHFRVVHDFVPEFEKWPDGAPVIVDRTLEPSDFGGDDA